MKLLFRQRILSLFDSYDIYDENGNTVYGVKGQLAWRHCLKICDPQGHELGLVKEKIITLLPKFELYEGGRYIGRISKKLSLFSPKFSIDFNGWTVEGNFLEWDYTIRDARGNRVAAIGKDLFHLSDTYVLDIAAPGDSLHVLMFALAMDAEKCSREKK